MGISTGWSGIQGVKHGQERLDKDSDHTCRMGRMSVTAMLPTTTRDLRIPLFKSDVSRRTVLEEMIS
jgi:hypothetical protein